MARLRRVRTTDSRHDFPIAPNLLDRNFTATAPNRIWLADMTYVETDKGWLYLATVLDLYSRKIVSLAMCDPLRAPPAVGSFAERAGADLIHHSDRGAQYAPADYRKVLPSAGFRASMSGRAYRYDNALSHVEKNSSIIAITQHGRKPNIFAYNEGFYNRTRRHSAFGHISPIEMELKAAKPCPLSGKHQFATQSGTRVQEKC
jgi:transposase InsO family protein